MSQQKRERIFSKRFFTFCCTQHDVGRWKGEGEEKEPSRWRDGVVVYLGLVGSGLATLILVVVDLVSLALAALSTGWLHFSPKHHSSLLDASSSCRVREGRRGGDRKRWNRENEPSQAQWDREVLILGHEAPSSSARLCNELQGARILLFCTSLWLKKRKKAERKKAALPLLALSLFAFAFS